MNRADDLLLDRILHCCRLSAGRMPIDLVVSDEAEKARARALLKGRHGNQKIGVLTEAERVARNNAAWRRALV